jgi:hypothetical protein
MKAIALLNKQTVSRKQSIALSNPGTSEKACFSTLARRAASGIA